MNKIFKVVWSEARNAYVVVSEIAKNHGSKSCSTKKLLTMLIATGVMTCASMAPAMAAPASDVNANSIQTNVLNSKYNLSVGTANENGTVPFFVNSNGAFYAANGKLVVDKDGKLVAPEAELGKVTADEGVIGNVVLKDGVFYKHTALRDGKLFVGDADGNYSQITTKGAKLGQVVIAEDGKISNVAKGVADTDAVNVSQLKQSIGDVHKRINKVGKEARGGIAGANAAAGLPQVYIPGKSMVAASAGTFKGESAVAVGYSRSSDNGKVIFKLQGNANTQGDVGGSVGVGYQW